MDSFKELVKISKDALNGKTVKKVEVKETKKEEKSVKKEDTKDYSNMNLTELKAVAKEQGIKGYSTMKKDELLANLK